MHFMPMGIGCDNVSVLRRLASRGDGISTVDVLGDGRGEGSSMACFCTEERGGGNVDGAAAPFIPFGLLAVRVSATCSGVPTGLVRVAAVFVCIYDSMVSCL